MQSRAVAIVTAVAALLLLAAAACGPIQSATAVSKAELSMDEAQNAGAGEYAPYEYEKANLFLTKAKELEGYSEYEKAEVYARHANEAAVQARDLAEKKKLRAATKRQQGR